MCTVSTLWDPEVKRIVSAKGVCVCVCVCMLGARGSES